MTEARQFNLMLETSLGPVRDEGSIVYLRPETAQGIFANFKNVLQTSRRKPPFGIAQIGKSFRNEITTKQFIFRTREFEQMEMEFFVPPTRPRSGSVYWLDERERWYLELGLSEDHLRLRPHDPDELSHYSTGTSDIEYLFPTGWQELEGIANRGDYDLRQHAQYSGEKLEYFDQATGERYVPHVVEPAAGRGPLHARVPRRRLRRGRAGGREAHRAAPAPATGAGQGRRSSRWSARTGSPSSRRRYTTCCAR